MTDDNPTAEFGGFPTMCPKCGADDTLKVVEGKFSDWAYLQPDGFELGKCLNTWDEVVYCDDAVGGCGQRFPLDEVFEAARRREGAGSSAPASQDGPRSCEAWDGPKFDEIAEAVDEWSRSDPE